MATTQQIVTGIYESNQFKAPILDQSQPPYFPAWQYFCDSDGIAPTQLKGKEVFFYATGKCWRDTQASIIEWKDVEFPLK